MVAIYILEAPVSTNNKHLLVIQDYFTKWVDAIPLQNHRAATISAEMVKVFCTYSIPDIVHSDQGQNVESTVSHPTLKARTTSYIPKAKRWDGCTVQPISFTTFAYICAKEKGMGKPPSICPICI